MPNALLWLSVLSVLVLVLDRERKVGTLWRWILLGIQIYLFGAFAHYGFAGLLLDLPRLLVTRLDGEWLGEGWTEVEGNALWLLTILILLFEPALHRIRRIFWPLESELEEAMP